MDNTIFSWQEVWEVVYIIMDVAGILLYGGISWVMIPKDRREWSSGVARMAALKVCILGIFIWLFLFDLGIHLNVQFLKDHFGMVPVRGLGLRALLIVPGLIISQGFIPRR